MLCRIVAVTSLSFELDEIDSKIIDLLQKDGRMQYKQISQIVGVSIPTVRERIKRLSELGLIKKFTVVTDYTKIAGRVRAIVEAKVMPNVQELRDALDSIDEVRVAYQVAGDKSIVLHVESDDLEHLDLTLNKLYELGVKDVTVYVITRVLKEEYGAMVKPNVPLQYRCVFCDCVIYGKPIIKHYYGGKYYFSGEECAKAFKERLDKKIQKQTL